MEYSIYVNREDVTTAEEEERDAFIRAVLESIGLDLDDIWPEDEVFDVKLKLKLIKFLNKYNIEIISDGDRGYKIYVDDEVVGEWFKPRVLLKKDPQERKLSKQLFYEIQLKYSSLFEDEEETEE